MTSKKLIYVTGAGRGIGRAISLKLAEQGYVVTGCARSLSELEETRKLSGGKIRIASVDVRDMSALKKWFQDEEGQTAAVSWGLVTAAGIYGPIGPFIENSWEHWKDSVDINLYGTVLSCRLFVQKLMARKLSGRIIMMSGGGATQPLPRFTSYCATKAAVVRFGETLAYELKNLGITVNSIAPGAVNTRLTDDLIAAGPDRAGKEMFEKAIKQKEEGGANPDKAGDLASYLLSENSANITGRLISAVWDPWENLHAQGPIHKDVYTLRRIVPQDREEIQKK